MEEQQRDANRLRDERIKVLVAAYDRVAAMRDTAGKVHAHSLPMLVCRGSPWVNAKNGTVEEVMAGHRVLMLS